MATHMSSHPVAHEIHRLRALENSQIIDGPRQPGFDKITSLASELFKAPIAAVTLIDKDTQWIKSRQGLDIKSTPRDAAICNHTIQHADPLIIADTHKDARTRNNPYVTGAPFIRSYIGAPLVTPDGYGIGALCVMDTKPRLFSAPEISVLKKLADLVMIHIELHKHASTDFLTGCFNRRHLFTEMSRQTERGLRLQEPSVLAIFDIDHFKEINDRHGHDVGDTILKDMATLVRERIRENDTFARIGGEEFALLLPSTTLEIIAPKINSLRTTVLQHRFALPLGLHVSISIGATDLSTDLLASENLRLADKALYHAKGSGRNAFALHRSEGIELFDVKNFDQP